MTSGTSWRPGAWTRKNPIVKKAGTVMSKADPAFCSRAPRGVKVEAEQPVQQRREENVDVCRVKVRACLEVASVRIGEGMAHVEAGQREDPQKDESDHQVGASHFLYSAA